LGSVKFSVVEKLIYPNKKLVKIDFYNFSFERSPLEGDLGVCKWVKKQKNSALKPRFMAFKNLLHPLKFSPKGELFKKTTTLFDTEPLI